MNLINGVPIEMGRRKLNHKNSNNSLVQAFSCFFLLSLAVPLFRTRSERKGENRRAVGDGNQ